MFFRKEKTFNVKVIATGFMSNEYTFFEFTGVISDWYLKRGGADNYAWWQMTINKRWDLDYKDFEFIVTELENKA